MGELMLLQILKLIHISGEDLLHGIGHVACSSAVKVTNGSILLKRWVIQRKDRDPIWNPKPSLRGYAWAFYSLPLLGASHFDNFGGLKRGFLLKFSFFKNSFASFFVPFSLFISWFSLGGGKRNMSWRFGNYGNLGAWRPNMGLQQRDQIW